jgi:hypothetical protein
LAGVLRHAFRIYFGNRGVKKAHFPQEQKSGDSGRFPALAGVPKRGKEARTGRFDTNLRYMQIQVHTVMGE